ncbi:uncharacterized protein PITG_04673 [Phytophthora infestans T30-4]|uniref:Uncharacterized protein n=1 Tax=Phytophthora infestans (strain T30-4) TaxID=403677 RepID=D0N1S3_PHYIT|nr:uncharacterized protein PITG_04673 [Phytophthora infestans T30-4]EEY68252.1 conserved hypothetical protein [Phytophthora infestans T30-4]|eukprot:XP_002905411.1 conserved hypothetical protein [Phytophthora infestans T30-4]
MWKDKLLTHINTQDRLYKRKQLEKGLSEVRVLMADFLQGSIEKTPSISDAIGDMQDLLNRVIPNFFFSTLPDLVSQMAPCDVIKVLEKDYGQGDAAGLIDLTRAWPE